MSLKRSCFKSIVKCDLKRSWWIGALGALFIFMTSTSQLYSNANSYDYYSYSRYDDMLDFCESMFGNYVIGMIMAVFVVLFLFSYLNKVNSVSFFHSLPATRNTLMGAHIVSSALLITLPMLINTIISLFAVGRGFKASWILMSFVMYLLYSFVAFSVTLVVSMLTGVSIASGIFSVIVGLLPVYIFAFVSELCQNYLYGYSDSKVLEDFLLNYVYLFPEALMSPKAIVYILMISAFIALSFFVYKKRHLENYGEVIAFPGLKGLFVVLFALCAGVLGYYYFQAFWGITSALTMLVFGTIGTIIAHMIANRSISLKGSLKPLLVTVCVILLLFIAFFFDLFGFERKIPDADDVEYVTINGMYYDEYSYVDSDINGEGRIRVNMKDIFLPRFSSKEDIESFLKLHKYAVEHIVENEDVDDDFFVSSYLLTTRDNIRISYQLKNGKTLTRSYSLPRVAFNELTYDIYNSEVYKKWKYPVIDGTEKNYKRVEIYDERNLNSQISKNLYMSDDETLQLIEAIKKDKISLPYEIMQLKNSGSFVTISLIYNKTYVSDEGKEYKVEHTDNYNIDENDVNTWAFLEEKDYFSDVRKVTVDDVTGVTVSVSEYLISEDELYLDDSSYGYGVASAANIETVDVVSSKYSYVTERYDSNYRTFVDREDIDQLFNIFMNHKNRVIVKDKPSVNLHIAIDYKNKAGAIQSKSRKITMYIDELPEILDFVKKGYQK